jgi:hypothetical protein
MKTHTEVENTNAHTHTYTGKDAKKDKSTRSFLHLLNTSRFRVNVFDKLHATNLHMLHHFKDILVLIDQ